MRARTLECTQEHTQERTLVRTHASMSWSSRVLSLSLAPFSSPRLFRLPARSPSILPFRTLEELEHQKKASGGTATDQPPQSRGACHCCPAAGRPPRFQIEVYVSVCLCVYACVCVRTHSIVSQLILYIVVQTENTFPRTLLVLVFRKERVRERDSHMRRLDRQRG